MRSSHIGHATKLNSDKGLRKTTTPVVIDKIDSGHVFVHNDFVERAKEGGHMASIVNRNGRLYLRVFVDGKEVRRSLHLGKRDMKLAKKIAAEFERRTIELAMTPDMPARLRVDKAFDEYTRRVTHARSTIEARGIFWASFAAWCEMHGIEDMHLVKMGDVARWQTEIARTRTAVTVNDMLRGCRAVWGHLLRFQVTDAPNPFVGIKNMQEPRTEPKFLPWGKVQDLLEAARADGPDAHLFVALAALGGLRRSEILAQRWEDIGDQSMLVAGTKTSSSKGRIPLHAALKEVLEQYRQEGGWVIKPENDMGDGSPKERFNHRCMWARVTKAAKVGAVTPHQLRHSIATRLLDLGHSLAEVAVFLRHGDLEATKIYADLRGVGISVGNVHQQPGD